MQCIKLLYCNVLNNAFRKCIKPEEFREYRIESSLRLKINEIYE